MFEVIPSWKSSFPTAHAGILITRNISIPLTRTGFKSRATHTKPTEVGKPA
ncbi:MAG: hypothetical protein IPM31_01955 [Anaerolineae bacterium]|nr:hypothetical protein [Anaerolineae bacterium]MBL8105812.1 hypothetical protein [Anaerolineales bacterium]